ncbi:ROK family protein [Cohnella herbarum]|uniref:ROK family protein n=1 Tax=Cohnella herbarum TaxID=2728023 RepID=A0A7Z2VHG5_9BACL|nr:ROK family protein [Cohnella herbarum]QJD83263.1 ROK family protein [Cohnella herbarum]QJD88494.1 ROK family protein [Cohnella herbarum]
MRAIGIDIGGTKIAVGLVDDGKIVKRHVITNRFFGEPQRMVAAIGKAIARLRAADGSSMVAVDDRVGDGDGDGSSGAIGVGDAGHEAAGSGDIAGIGVGCPGWVVDGIVYDAVNLGISKFALEDVLAEVSGLPTRAENDARTALLCERRYGTLQGSVNGATVTFGTGIGGALMLERRLYRGSFGCAGEIGHLTLSGSDEPCPCGKIGCFERTASVTALVQLAKRHGLKAEDGLAVCALAKAGDEVAIDVLERYTDAAAKGVIELVMLLDLDTVVIGGAISRQRKLFVDSLRKKVNLHLPRCRVTPAAFANDAGIIGAVELVSKGDARQRASDEIL